MAGKKILLIFFALLFACTLLFSQEVNQKELEKRRLTLLYGLESDIVSLIGDLITEKDTSFSNDLLNVFEQTKNSSVKQKIFSYFTILKDARLTEFALSVLKDPYEEDKQTVTAVFKYVSALEIKESSPYILELLVNESEDYFDLALSAVGNVGGAEEALFLADYLKNGELSTIRKQTLMKSLGQLQAIETWDTLVEIAKDEEENTFVRMYASEAIGNMKKKESVDVLVDLFNENDVNLRTYVVKGLSNFTDEKAIAVILDAFKDNYYKVRLEAAAAAKKNIIIEAVPYLLYRSENDPENTVKYACYDALGAIQNDEAKNFLKTTIENIKLNETARAKAASVILEHEINDLVPSVVSVASQTLLDDKSINLRYALGKEFTKYANPQFQTICAEFIAHKDVATKGIGLDIFAKNKFPQLFSEVQAIADNEKEGVNQRKAKLTLEKIGVE